MVSKINTWSGSIEIVADEIEVIAHGRPPHPQIVSPGELTTDRFYGRLVATRAKVLEVLPRQRGTDVRLHAGRELLTRSYDAASSLGYLWHEFGDLHLVLP